MNARSRAPKKLDHATNKSKQQRAKLRIISGQWRSRMLPIPELEGLRPTPDRVRETLFNWINTYVPGAKCADLFCGSGALGLEALSRSAKSCVFVDASRVVTQQMQQNLATLGCKDALTLNQDALSLLKLPIEAQPNLADKAPFDLVFIDPPFRKSWVENILPLLEQGWLAEGALVYLEMEKETPLPSITQSWDLLKEKTAGQLTYRLFQVYRD
ncbi:16S rRNA (guanine(966)-N(2))-methyltransferase RsmD [Marinomonas sp. PE14-40]|uniref:16S rRNA (guanine(966)-N(2))-methyltransferase RsmD n=1 Tax=Marinomonas sp. PE14-40 TaxID=3060621 RepID=UPI003F67CD17